MDKFLDPALEKLLDLAVQKGASDLHLIAFSPPVLRINRRLYILDQEKEISPKETEKFAFSLLNPLQQEIFLKEKEIDFSFDFKRNARFRTNIFFQKGTISLALRLLRFEIKTISELNLPTTLLKFTEIKQGFVLICGPASHGKSTALAALIEEINKKEARHIITIEDPIEYLFEQKKSVIEQREVNSDTKSFVRALKSVFRQDPDVIMIGEMRDSETMSIALRAAETGHLVFATLHTNSAAQTITRIVDSFPPSQQNQIRAQLADVLFGIISLRLIPTLKIKTGLVPACEILFNTPAVANLIRENKIHEIPNIIETSAKLGMISLEKYLAELIKKQIITLQEGQKYSLKPDLLKEMI
ncbi:MAG: type IV pilus twitching motility protein PilT [Minisyncoccales bacterium]